MTKNNKPLKDKQREAIRKIIERPSKLSWGFFGYKILLKPFVFIYNCLVAFGDLIINSANFLWLGITNFPNLIKDIFKSFKPKSSKKNQIVVSHSAVIKANHSKIVTKQVEAKTKVRKPFFGFLFKKKNLGKVTTAAEIPKVTPVKSIEPVTKINAAVKPNIATQKINTDIDLSNASAKEILQNLAQVVATLAENDRNYRQSVQKKVRWGQILVFVAIIILIVNTVFVLFQSPFQNASASGNVTQTTAGVQNLITDNTQPGIRVVENFLTTKIIAEVGSSINVQKDKIITKGTNNCKTPVSPPPQNGCEFVLIPSSLSIPIRGTLFKSIKFEATITGESEIQIIKKNYEKGRVIDNIGSVTATNLNKKMVLPEVISGVEGLGIKLWEKDGSIEIRKIVIEYFNVESLVPVSGKITDWKKTEPVIGSIYFDINENKKFDIKTDRPWICKPNFPGLMPVNIDVDGSFVMYRDESCFIDVKPDFFYTDEKKAVLPPADWLLVLNDGKEVYNFNVDVKEKEKILEFQSIE